MPDHILMAVKTGLALEGQPSIQPADLTGAPAGSIFRMPLISGFWGRYAEGLEDPYLCVPDWRRMGRRSEDPGYLTTT